MGVHTRGLDIKAGAKQNAADKAAHAEAEVVIQQWNDQLALGRGLRNNASNQKSVGVPF
jgi:hypothetical protein